MSVNIGNLSLTSAYVGSTEVKSIYAGSTMVWQNKPRTRVDYEWESARTSPYGIMFMGSSTTQGYQILHSEQFVPQMTAHIVSKVLGVNATPAVKKTSGGLAKPSAPGFHFVNAGVGGTGVKTYWNSQRADLVSSYQPELIIHMIGSNDYSDQMPPATYKQSVMKAINEINSQTPPCKHLLIHSFKRLDVSNPTYSWDEYGQALKEIAESRSDTDFCDVMRVIGDRWPEGTKLLSDNIHADWDGNTHLARAVAEYLTLDSNDGEPIYEWDLLGSKLANNTLLSSKQPYQSSYVKTALTSSGNNRPIIKDRNGVRSADFYNGAKKMTADWGGAFAAPMTMFFVARMWNDNFGTDNKPIFTRANPSDNGYLWAWRETNANLVKAANGSAFSPGITVPRTKIDNPSIFAITFHENGWSTIYPNATYGTSVAPVAPDASLGPWMRSLKLMTNTSETNWGEADMYGIYFYKGMTPEKVADKMRELGRQFGITVEGAPVDDGPVVITGTSGTEARDSFRSALTARGLDYKTVREVPFLLDTSNVTDMSYMFSGCSSLTSVTSMDTSNVTNMNGMFSGCSSLTSVPNMDTSQVTSMSSMFSRCTALTSVPNIDTSNVTTMSSMFQGCSSLTSTPAMDTSQVTSMYSMFLNCPSLTSVPDMNTSNVTNMSSTFPGCAALTDGNVRCIGKKSGVSTSSMIYNSGLTRLPFYDANGNWTG